MNWIMNGGAPFVAAAVFCLAGVVSARGAAEVANAEPSRLAVVWTSADPDVAHRVCLMYTHAAAKNKWFDEVRLIVWGPSARLLAGDKDLQAKLAAMQKDGVILRLHRMCRLVRSDRGPARVGHRGEGHGQATDGYAARRVQGADILRQP